MDRQHWLILIATVLASGMAFLDGTVTYVALPTIQSDLKAEADGIQWIVNSFILMLASFILISGSLGDKFGRRKIFSLGIFIFTVASGFCSFSQDINTLIFGRTLQGLGAAMMIPGSLSIIHSCFEERYQGRAIGLWSGLAGGVATLGPFVGGFLVENFNWQSIFLINIPIGMIALFLALKFIPESKNPDAKGLDWLGTILITLGLLGVAFGLINGPKNGWDNPSVWGTLLFGIISIIGFIEVEKREKYPVVPLHIFKSPMVIGANLATLFLYLSLNGLIFFLAINLQQIQGYTPTLAGMSMLPSILLITFLSGWGGALADKYGPRNLLIIGPIIVGLGMFYLSLAGINANYWTDYLPGLILFGFGMSLVVAPITKSALAVNPKYSGTASGVNNAVARVAALLAIALLGAIMITAFKSELIKNIQASNLDSSEKQLILDQKDKFAGIEIPKNFDLTAVNEAKGIVQDSFVSSFKLSMWICAGLALLSALVSYLTIKNPRRS